MATQRICSVEGCGKPRFANGFCSPHYNRYRKDRTPTNRAYYAMKTRCLNPRQKTYARYGGRGIKVCDRWLGPDGFKNFLSDMGERPEGMTLDRIDNDGNYEPSNCRWATRETQQRNTSRNRIVNYAGRDMTLVEACTLHGIDYHLVAGRLFHGWTFEQAVNEPKLPGKHLALR